MISLTCTNCKAEMEVDDAFAGGVCRCRHCGAIQTVPSHLKKGVALGTIPPKPGRTLFTRKGKSPSPVASGTARTQSPTIPAAAPGWRVSMERLKTLSPRHRTILISAAVAVTLLLILIIWLLAR